MREIRKSEDQHVNSTTQKSGHRKAEAAAAARAKTADVKNWSIVGGAGGGL